jgi:GNAT superfamily N-acetyltransferase
MSRSASGALGLRKRCLRVSDHRILAEATLANLNWKGERFTAADVQQTPAFCHYSKMDPSRGDFGVIAEDDRGWAGVVWVLFLPADHPGYGFVSPEHGELSVCVHERVRRAGLGRELMLDVIQIARQRGYPGLSLSVEAGNGARELYCSLGFVVADPGTLPGTMILTW